MANGIEPQGYYTLDPSIGGGVSRDEGFQYLLDPSKTAGAYRASLQSNLFPSDVGNYDYITSSSPFTQGGPFNLLPTGEGLLTFGTSYVNPLAGLATRAAISSRNAEALETLADQGILTRLKDPEPSGKLGTFLGAKFKGDTGQYRFSEDTEKELLASGKSGQEFFQDRFDSEYGQANELAQYLDQIAYSTQGQFFQTDIFGNPTPYSKYVDRQGNIKPDALENWKQFGSQDKRGALNMFDSKEDQGTQPDSGDKGFTFGEGYIGSPTEQQTSPAAFMSQLSTDGGIEDLPAAGTGRSGPPGFTPNSEKQSGVNRSGVTFNTPLSQVNRIAASVARDPGSFNKSKGFFDRGR